MGWDSGAQLWLWNSVQRGTTQASAAAVQPNHPRLLICGAPTPPSEEHRARTQSAVGTRTDATQRQQLAPDCLLLFPTSLTHLLQKPRLSCGLSSSAHVWSTGRRAICSKAQALRRCRALAFQKHQCSRAESPVKQSNVRTCTYVCYAFERPTAYLPFAPGESLLNSLATQTEMAAEVGHRHQSICC